jgi:hypothetical protein
MKILNMSLECFLTSIRQSQYLELFLENGIDDLETLNHLKEHHFEKLGVKIGHAIKISKALSSFPAETPPTIEAIQMNVLHSITDPVSTFKTSTIKTTRHSTHII